MTVSPLGLLRTAKFKGVKVKLNKVVYIYPGDGWRGHVTS